MTIKQLREARAGKVSAMEQIKAKGDAIEATDLNTIKTMADEIKQYDMQIEAIEVTRESAMKASAPAPVKEATAKEDFEKGFVAYLKGHIDERELNQFRAAMGSGTTGKGNEIVPEDFLRELQTKIKEFGIIAPLCRNITTADNGQLSIPFIDDTNNAGAWTDENALIVDADVATNTVTMDAWKVATAVVISEELLQDAFFDVGSYMAEALAVRLSRTIEDAIINGDGTKKLKGILEDQATKEQESKTTLVIEAADCLAMIGKIQPSSRNGAKFFASDEAIMAMTGWVGTDGRPLLQAQADATQADGIKYSLYGYEVIPNYNLGGLGVGDNPIIFGNPQAYMIRSVQNITVKRSDEYKFLNDQSVFKATARLDGKVISANDSFVKLKIKA